jgi:hypothetical protein
MKKLQLRSILCFGLFCLCVVSTQVEAGRRKRSRGYHGSAQKKVEYYEDLRAAYPDVCSELDLFLELSEYLDFESSPGEIIVFHPGCSHSDRLILERSTAERYLELDSMLGKFDELAARDLSYYADKQVGARVRLDEAFDCGEKILWQFDMKLRMEMRHMFCCLKLLSERAVVEFKNKSLPEDLLDLTDLCKESNGMKHGIALCERCVPATADFWSLVGMSVDGQN